MDDFTEFTDSETKKVAALQEIADTVDRLDTILEELKGTDNKLKAWYEQKKPFMKSKKSCMMRLITNVTTKLKQMNF
ncbi:hypothetical protein RAK27_05670 [Carnobacterium maltaromaticum]|uniref:Uncharacterized protein n=1 Tax=Carnobacterium maltaromaticum TaxID=2751 RepID=A0AAW9K785_CARML|nr:hypothetical protein [Carnobacterium maltaromaticum]MDZ5758143.1 hypothetical protein [Carnobacterium maltaromaticum]